MPTKLEKENAHFRVLLEQAYGIFYCPNRGKTSVKVCHCEGCELSLEIAKVLGVK